MNGDSCFVYMRKHLCHRTLLSLTSLVLLYISRSHLQHEFASACRLDLFTKALNSFYHINYKFTYFWVCIWQRRLYHWRFQRLHLTFFRKKSKETLMHALMYLSQVHNIHFAPWRRDARHTCFCCSDSGQPSPWSSPWSRSTPGWCTVTQPDNIS